MSILDSDETGFAVALPDWEGGIPRVGRQAFMVTAIPDTTVEIVGNAWDNVPTDFSAAPSIVLMGHRTHGQISALEVHGARVDEVTRVPKDGFCVMVKNLSTGASGAMPQRTTAAIVAPLWMRQVVQREWGMC